MTNRNIKYKVVTRIQCFADDNIYTNTQYEYPLAGSSVNNACRMRFNLKGNLGDLNLSQNARMVVETCCIPSLTNAAGKYAILRLVCPTQDKYWDSKKGANGNPIILSIGLNSTVGTLNILYNASEFFYNLNVPHNIFSNGVIDLELEVPTATSAIEFITGTPLSTFYINFVIIDADPEITQDTTLAPPIDYKTYNTNVPIRSFYT